MPHPNSSPRDHFVNKLEGLDYRYIGESKKARKYKRNAHRVYVPKTKNMLPDGWVIATLRQAGCEDPEIREYLAQAKA